MKKLTAAVVISLLFLLAITACSSNKDDDYNANPFSEEEHAHNRTAEVPEGLMEAANAKYMEGSHVKIKANHMKGMNGAEATVLSAYDTTAYVVSYMPTTGGDKVENHKWVIQEEINDSGKDELAPGTKVTLEADHMPGMKGAKATIEKAEKATVYMVDYTPTTGGKKVTNHKWLTENELEAD
ncbi:YdhK family protein [Niallia sp. 03133]|uniref:YdhK family protein n=1 Tax=Niallia sp. 03133 TaxID=3458060 RepID=UPI004043B981